MYVTSTGSPERMLVVASVSPSRMSAPAGRRSSTTAYPTVTSPSWRTRTRTSNGTPAQIIGVERPPWSTHRRTRRFDTAAFDRVLNCTHSYTNHTNSVVARMAGTVV